MAAAIMPALQVGGRAAIAQLPGLLAKVKTQLPSAYNSVQSYLGKSNTNIEKVISTATTRGDKMLTQSALESFMRGGVPAAFIASAAPLFTVAELESIVIQFHDIDKLERKVADSRATAIDGDPDAVLAHDNLQIVRLCKALGISSSVLADVCAFVATRGPAQIARYQRFETSMGRKPV